MAFLAFPCIVIAMIVIEKLLGLLMLAASFVPFLLWVATGAWIAMLFASGSEGGVWLAAFASFLGATLLWMLSLRKLTAR